jgi:hypothetical protein
MPQDDNDCGSDSTKYTCIDPTTDTGYTNGPTNYLGKVAEYDPTTDERWPYSLFSSAAIHKNVPVTNEKCLYALWMCACWANSEDGCLCAFENSG